jgi:hypothetical protein
LGGQILTGRIIRVSFTHHLIKHKRMICICIIQSRETYHGVTLAFSTCGASGTYREEEVGTREPFHSTTLSCRSLQSSLN